MKQSNSNKAVSVLLSVAMCPMLVPTAAFAAEDGTVPGQAATQAQPAEETQAVTQAEDAAGQAVALSAEDSAQDVTQSDEDATAGSVEVNGKSFNTLQEAFDAAVPDAEGIITYTINGKVTLDNSSKVADPNAYGATYSQSLFNEAAYPNQVKKVHFVGGIGSPEICINDPISVFNVSLKNNPVSAISFDSLTLSRTKAKYSGNYAEGTNYFTAWNSDGSVSYSNCVFPNGAHNNWYGSTSYDDCKFANDKSAGGGSKYGLWVSAATLPAVSTTVSNCAFTKARGMKVYYTENLTVTPSLTLSKTTFTGLADPGYAAINVDKPVAIELSDVSATECQVGLLKSKDGVIEGTIPCGSNVSGSLNVQKDSSTETGKGITAGTFTGEVQDGYLADGITMKDNGDGTYGAQETPANAVEVVSSKGVVTQYAELNSAAVKAARNGTIKLLADVTVSSLINIYQSGTYTFDLGHYRIKSAVTTSTAPVIQVNASAAKVVVNAESDGGIDGGSGAAKANYAFYVRTGSLTINGGSYTVGLDGQGKANHIIYAESSSSKVVINGGCFAAEDPSYTLNCKDNSGASIQVNGGSFVGFDPFNNLAEGEGTNFVSEGAGVNRVVAEDGSVSYSVAKGVAQVVDADGKSLAVYETLEAAVAAAQDGQTVKLTSDIALAEAVVVKDADKSITLDLNGKTVTRDGGNAISVNGGKLVIKDSTAKQPSISGGVISEYVGGAIKNTGDGKTPCVSVSNAGQLTVESGSLQAANQSAIYVDGNRNPESSADVSPQASKVTVNGGYLKSQEYGIGIAGRGAVLDVNGGVVEAMDNAVIGGNGTNSGKEYDGDTVININGGDMIGHIKTSGYIACGVYHPQKGTLNITGGNIYVENGVGVLMRGGNANITGGTITTTGNLSGKVGDSNVIANCYGVYVDGSAGYYGSKVDGFSASISGDANIATSSQDVPVINVSNKDDGTTNASASVSGGTFSSEVPSDYCAEGFAPAASTDAEGNTTYGVAAGLTNFWGGSLRIDAFNNGDGTFATDVAELRFGFNFDLPEGAARKAFGFKWGLSADKLVYSVEGVNTRDAVEDHLASDPDGVKGTISNIVVTGIPKSAFGQNLYAQMWVTYELNGEEYTIQTDVQNRSVQGIAEAIQAAGNEGKISKDSNEYRYAQALLGNNE